MNIAIASGKGGTGKTFLSTNLAAFLSDYDESSSPRVVLTDLDVEEPNSGLFFDGKINSQKDIYRKVPKWNEERCTLCGECSTFCNFNALAFLGKNVLVFDNLCHSCHACSELCPENALPMIDHKTGEMTEKTIRLQNNKLEFVEGRLVIGEESAVFLINEIKDKVNEKFNQKQTKIYDAPPGTSCAMIEAVKDAQMVILITEPTPFGFHDLKLAVETIRKLNLPFCVVINKYGIGNNDVENYCKENNIDIAGKIPQSRHIAETYSKGELVYNKIPEVKKVLEQISANIFKQEKK